MILARTHILAFVLVICAASVSFGATYEIGPGKTYTTIGAFAWEDLSAGDTVKIYYKSTPYYEKFGVWAQGTSGSPVTVQGVAGGGGELPVIDGNDATTRLALDYWGEERSMIKIGGCSVPSGDPTPSYLVFENLDIKTARPPYSFTCDAGTEKDYVDKAATFYIEKGNNITIRNCILRDCGNGFMTSNASEDILLEGCHLYDNGITDSIYQHSIYTESHGIIFQWNHLDALRSGCTGNNLKDRSSGAVIRYNWIEDGNRQLDLVDSEFSAIRSETDYGKDKVYGNILYETGDVGNRQMVHFGGDSGTTTWYRPGPLRFYNNTCISKRTVSTYLFRRSHDETIDAYNNIAYVTAAGNTFYVVENDGTGTVTVSYNWFKTGYNLGEATDGGNNETGSAPGFVDFNNEDFHITSSSGCRDEGRSLMSGDPSVTYQYVKHHDKETRPTDSTMDIGAFEYDSGGPPPDLEITTTSLPNGTVDVAYSETLAATGGVTPYTWSVISGSLPSGLSLASSTGVISGTPTTEETANFTVQVTDSQDPADTDTQALSITIDPGADPLDITTTSLPDGTKKQ
ncbi:MAG: putative Ig domain-containing protein, partial [Planctomycetota bacterium]